MNAYSVNVQLLNDDCLIALKTLADNSIDSVVTDPPYGLEFMGKEWDKFTSYAGIKTPSGSPHARRHSVSFIGSNNPTCRNCGGLKSLNSEGSGGRKRCKCEKPDFPNYRLPALKKFQEFSFEWAKECLRVLKPGGFLLAFGGSRTYHRLACAVEDSGFEIRDQIMWVYGSGFPKSLNIGKAVDKSQGKEREVVGEKQHAKKDFKDNLYAQAEANKNNERVFGYGKEILTKGNSGWEGWGTALKPAHEPIVVARKPLSEKTVVANILKWGVGGINIDACRVGKKEGDRIEYGVNGIKRKTGNVWGKQYGEIKFDGTQGRFPANLIHDGSQEVMDLFPNTGQKGKCYDYSGKKEYQVEGFIPNNKPNSPSNRGDSGSAARFFYCAKASSKERNDGLDDLKDKPAFDYGSIKKSVGRHGKNTPRKNHHPTVKPILLMKYLICLVTPKNGLVLDPFLGSGSTGIAAKSLGYRFVGIEQNKEYFEIAKTRIERG